MKYKVFYLSVEGDWNIWFEGNSQSDANKEYLTCSRIFERAILAHVILDSLKRKTT